MLACLRCMFIPSEAVLCPVYCILGDYNYAQSIYEFNVIFSAIVT